MLRPGGRLLLTVPDHGRLRRLAVALLAHERHYDPQGQHLRFYTRRSLDEALRAAGFAPRRIDAVGGPPGPARRCSSRSPTGADAAS